MRVLGVDPGLGATGYAIVENPIEPVLLEAGVIRPRRGMALPDRLLEVYRELGEVMAEFRPEAMGLEALFSKYDHPRSALQMAHVRGVICLVGAESGVPVIDISPASVKLALTGSGTASKAQIQRMVMQMFKLSEAPSPPDVADAIAVATTVGRRLLGGIAQVATAARSAAPKGRSA